MYKNIFYMPCAVEDGIYEGILNGYQLTATLYSMDLVAHVDEGIRGVGPVKFEVKNSSIIKIWQNKENND